MKMSKSLSLLAAATPAVLLATPTGARQNQFLRRKAPLQVGAGLARGLQGMSMSTPLDADADADALELSPAAYAAQEVVQALETVLPNEVQACVGLSDFEPIVESIIADAAEAFQTLTDYGTSIVETIIADTAEELQTLTEDGASTASKDEDLVTIGEIVEQVKDVAEQVKDVADALGEFIEVNGMAPIAEAVSIVVQGATPDEEEDSAVAAVLEDVKGRISEAIANRLETAGCLRDIDVAQMIWGSASDFDWDETYLGKARASILDAIFPEARY